MKKLLLFAVTITMLISCAKKQEILNVSDSTVITDEVMICDVVSDDKKSEFEGVLRIHKGKFAFCGASGAVPTGKKIVIQGVTYDEGCAICPVLDGPSFSNLAMYGSGGTWGDFNVKNNFKTPDGTDNTIWSLFWYYDTNDSVPQFNPKSKKWEIMPSSNRSFIINTDSVSTSESNMFCMPGIVFDTTSTGIILARCYGPLNEAAVPLRKALPLKTGMISITAAKKGVPYPVGTAFPVKE